MGAEQVARELLQQLQQAVDDGDVSAVLGLFEADPVLFGTAAEAVGAQEVRDYLLRVLAQDGRLRWSWDRVVPVLDEPGALAFAVVGSVGFDDTDGAPLDERQHFRLTCVAVLRDGRWRLRHFHGSVPQA